MHSSHGALVQILSTGHVRKGLASRLARPLVARLQATPPRRAVRLLRLLPPRARKVCNEQGTRTPVYNISHGEGQMAKVQGDTRNRSLAMGTPSDELLQKASIACKTAADHCMSQEGAATLMQYGNRYEGYQPFRQSLAKLLTREYGEEVLESDLMTNCGATQGLHFLVTQFFPTGGIAFVEETSFGIALKLLRDSGLRLVPVPIDEDGLVTEELDRVASRELKGTELSEDARMFPALVYTIPTYHNPTGCCLSEARSKEFVRVARKHDLFVVADDVYNLLPLTEKVHRRLFAYDSKSDADYKGNVVSNGTFSKIFAPGMRLGWIEAPKRIRDKLVECGYVISGGPFNHFGTGIMASVMQLGLLDDLLIQGRRFYKSNALALFDILDKGLPPSVTYKRPEGGYFVWIKLPESTAAKDVVDLCQSQHGVKILSGDMFSPSGHLTNFLRVCFSFLPKDRLISEAEIVVKCIRTVVEKTSTSNF